MSMPDRAAMREQRKEEARQRMGVAGPVEEVPGVEPKYEVGQNVSWRRPGLPVSFGAVAEVKVYGHQVVYFVRDKHNHVFAMPEPMLTGQP